MTVVQRIGIFLDVWDLGEVSSFCFHLATGLQEHGYEVTLIVGHRGKPSHYPAWQSMLEEKNFRVVDLQLPRVKPKMQSYFMLREITGLKLDVLILNRFSAHLAALNALSAHVRMISVGHSDHSRDYIAFVAAQYFVHRHVTVSREILQACTAICPPAWRYKLALCHYGLAPLASRSLYVPEGPMQVVYCGRFDFADNRLQDLPPVWKGFLAKGGYGRLNLIGEGDVLRWLRQQFAVETEAGTVRFLESQRGAALAETLGHQEIVLSLANWNGLGLLPLKAVLMGCYPVLSETRSGHREIVQELGGGVLCPVGDTAAFTQVLLRCAAIRPGLLHEREKLRRAAQEKFGLARMVQDYDALIQAVLAEPLGTPSDHLGEPVKPKPHLWNDIFQRPPKPATV